MAYRTDNIPLILRPFYLTISYVAAVFLYVFFVLPLRLTLRIEFQGQENLQKGPFISCIWHEDLGPFFATFKRLNSTQIWMNHPVWYMKPIHFLLGFIGIKELVLGSSGHKGKEAAFKLAALLKEKKVSTTFAIDGPLGPPKVVKKGALFMAIQTGLPIIPLSFVPKPYFVLRPSWDGKKCPIPFGKMRIICHAPLQITEENLEEMSKRLEDTLNQANS